MEISGLDTVLVIIAAVVIAMNQALRDASKMRTWLPGWVKSTNWNYIPAVLIVLAAVVFIVGKINPPVPPAPPAPTVKTVIRTMTVEDPAQAARIADLEKQLAAKPATVAPVRPKATPSAPASVAPPPATNSIGTLSGNNGIVTQGQFGSNTLIQGPLPRHLKEADGAKLLAALPKSRKIVVSTISETEPQDLAVEIVNFLKSNGYEVQGPDVGFYVGGNPRGVEIDLYNNDLSKPIVIVVGANVPKSP